QIRRRSHAAITPRRRGMRGPGRLRRPSCRTCSTRSARNCAAASTRLGVGRKWATTARAATMARPATTEMRMVLRSLLRHAPAGDHLAGPFSGSSRTDPFGRPLRGDLPRRPVVIDTGDIPDLTPFAGLAIIVVAALLALGAAGSVASRWETIQLWLHQVPFSPAGEGAVTDPIFGRDIGFFLFQLPFLRRFQSVA